MIFRAVDRLQRRLADHWQWTLGFVEAHPILYAVTWAVVLVLTWWVV